jgi:hypothetical protein
MGSNARKRGSSLIFKEIRECHRRAEECSRLSENALSPSAIQDYLDMEQRWLSLAFAERQSNFVEPFRRRNWPKR